MPLQHINDDVLDRMRRRTSRKQTETLLEKLRKRIPGMTLRTTFISGFPGETDAQHNELVKFVREFGFDNMGVFPYSPEPGTPAGTMHAKGQGLPPEVIQKRIDELMSTQQAVVFARNQELADSGAEFDVLIDSGTSTTGRKTAGVSKSASKIHVGRTYQQAPQIDAVTYVHSRTKLAPGELLRCKLTAADGYDLIAQPTAELESKMSLKVVR
jgi:ribosomal protein S12 methylthiotransferase